MVVEGVGFTCCNQIKTTYQIAIKEASTWIITDSTPPNITLNIYHDGIMVAHPQTPLIKSSLSVCLNLA